VVTVVGERKHSADRRGGNVILTRRPRTAGWMAECTLNIHYSRWMKIKRPQAVMFGLRKYGVFIYTACGLGWRSLPGGNSHFDNTWTENKYRAPVVVAGLPSTN